MIGATIGGAGEDLDFNGPLLVPGFGAQGGTVDDIRRIFGAAVAARPPQLVAGDAAARPRPWRDARRRARLNDELRPRMSGSSRLGRPAR